MRLFLGIGISEAIRDALVGLQQELARELSGLRWVRGQSLHLTLIFLGEVTETSVETLAAAAREACSAVEPGAARLRGLGCYPPRGRARVLWVGLEDDGTLVALHRRLAAAVRSQGLLLADRHFEPHLTLGRARSGVGRSQVETVLQREADLGSWPIRSCALFRSHLGASGARYEVLSEFPLTGGT